MLYSEDMYDFVVIIGGVNDSAGYLGSDFYAHHMEIIVRSVLKRGAVPVILELPEYGIENVESGNLVGFIRRRLFRQLYDGGSVNVIANYRQAFFEKLSDNFGDSEYIFVEFNRISVDYEKSTDIYGNYSHLNDEGKQFLTETISSKINTWLIDHWR